MPKTVWAFGFDKTKLSGLMKESNQMCETIFERLPKNSVELSAGFWEIDTWASSYARLKSESLYFAKKRFEGLENFGTRVALMLGVLPKRILKKNSAAVKIKAKRQVF